MAEAFSGDARILVFAASKGRTCAIDQAEVQAVRFLWDPIIVPPDGTRDQGMIEATSRRRAEPLEVDVAYPDEVSEMFLMLDCGSEVGSFLGFHEEDGELLQLNPKEVVWRAVPTRLLLASGDDLAAGDDGPEIDA